MSQQYPPISRTIVGIIEIEFKMEVITGLIIRVPLAKTVIGGIDQQPMSTRFKYTIGDRKEEIEVPYIPGSSLKGRMRSLLELYEGAELYTSDGKIYLHVRELKPESKACKDIRHALDNLFGSPSIHARDVKTADEKLFKELIELYAPTRLIVRDMYPTQEYVNELYKLKGSRGMIMFYDFLEEKTENRIDRITSAADPRTIYRIKPGVEFKGLMKVVLYDVDIDSNKLNAVKDYMRLIAMGLKLIEDTYLGGAGTRGYGKVAFKDINVKLKTRDYYMTGDQCKITTVKTGIKNVDDFLKSIDEICDKIISHVKGKQ